MLYRQITSPESVEACIESGSTSSVRDGNVVHILDDDTLPLMNEDSTIPAAYIITRTMRGSAETIPRKRAAYVSHYNGLYVPEDQRGYLVDVYL